MSPELVTFAQVEDATAYLRGVLAPTPMLHRDALARLSGRDVYVKAEHLQRTGSFKARGALNCLRHLDPGTHVIASSAGNHAQGVAFAAGVLGMHATIFMPQEAPLPKIEATRNYGAEVRLIPGGVDDCLELGRAEAHAMGSAYVHPFDDVHVIAGQGSVGIEIAEQAPSADTVLVPVGGGGLIAGVAVALRKLAPNMRIVGVESDRVPSMTHALATGRVERIELHPTIADGIALKCPSELTVAHVRDLVDDVVCVSDEEIAQSVVALAERAKAVVEPSGAAGLAALLAGRVPADAGEVVVVTTGGNIDPLLLAKVIEFGLAAAHRYLVARVVVSDRPGALAAVTQEVSSIGLNIVSVEHHRYGRDVTLGTVEVMLYLESRGPEDRDRVLDKLADAGFDAEIV